jgi:glycosyltransferase involved in cell wall biosynthesis
VSFGAGASGAARLAMAKLRARYPDYETLVAQHVKRDAAGPYRFAITIELLRRLNRPTILMATHDQGGGVRRHILELVERIAGEADCLLLEATARGAALSVPALPGHPDLTLPADRMSDLALVLRSAGVTRVHLHHLMSMDLDVRALLHRLGVPFDVTVHDYFAVCPQVNLLPWVQGAYCGEPDVAGCNACIAERPSHGSRDIVSWRLDHAWQFFEAERVFCPSEDVRRRLTRYGLDHKAIVVPHEPVVAKRWPIAPPPGNSGRLRVALLGVLANHKGVVTAMSLASAADAATLSLHLIGYAEQPLPEPLARRITMTGKYEDGELPTLLAKVKPHVVWFPAQWPETYSYTLSAAIDAGLPIVATRIGAFPERLAGRPLTWLVDPEASIEAWLAAFAEVRRALERHRTRPKGKPRKPVANYYRERYVCPPATRQPDEPVDIRHEGRISIVVVPERFPTGALTPCCYIRLLQPLDYPAIGGEFDVVLADPAEALRYRADIIVTQRHAVTEFDAADALIKHCRRQDIALLYDLDDDLRHIPRDHPDAERLRPQAPVVSRLVRGADAVWVSTPALAATLARLRDDVRVVENGLDERLWTPTPPSPHRGPVRILFMGTATHDADLAIVETALARVKAAFGEHVSMDLLGVSGRRDLPAWVNRVSMPVHATSSYPGFVDWITRQHWDIGIAPLADTPFNRCKSAIKALDYAALGLPVLASDRAVYRGTLADGRGGWLLPDDADMWFAALVRLIRDTSLRRHLGEAGRAAFRTGTLAAQAADRRAAWLALPRTPQRTKRAVHLSRGAGEVGAKRREGVLP